MRITSGNVHLAPSDLSNFLSCRHLSALDLRAARGEAERPVRSNAMIEQLRERGIAHERAYLAHLRAQGLTIACAVGGTQVPTESATVGGTQVPTEVGTRVPPTGTPGKPAIALTAEETLAAMREGVDIIYQATLADETWSGVADFLRKIPKPSELGGWSYEALDTKLARDTRAGTILQLCVYSYVLGKLQKLRPEHMYVVSPGREFEPLEYRTDDYSAYFRLLERNIGGFVRALGEPIVGGTQVPTEVGTRVPPTTYPEMVSHCELCAWWEGCEKRRRADDALCYVAGISRGQIKSLREAGINKLADLAQLEWGPTCGSDASRDSPSGLASLPHVEALTRVRDQARIQWRGRERKERLHELKEPFGAEHGLALLPEPTPDDIFLDFEGNHFAEQGVQEYLAGYVTRGVYTALWARTPEQEKRAFERFMDLATETRARNPAAHIYHFAPYEPAALKRLMGRYATREQALDALLHGHAFVDLYTVLRRSLIASVERYSIKDMEPFFGYARRQDLREASMSRRIIEQAVEAGDWDETLEPHVRIVEDYNREDCESAERLRDWLEKLRAEAIASGKDLPRPGPGGEPAEQIKDLDRELQRLRDGLLEGVPADRDERTDEQQARFVLAHLMEFHRREDKAAWWEYFRLIELDDEDYANERRAVAGLELVGPLEDGPRWQRYRFPPQELDVRVEKDVAHEAGTGRKIGTVMRVDSGNRTLDIQKRKDAVNEHPSHVVLYNRVKSDPLRASLMRLGAAALANGFGGQAPYRAAEALLLRQAPSRLQRDGERTEEAACRIATTLDGQVLAIQGPPGTGKTWMGGRIICALKRKGLKVGVTAVSHKVIIKLLEEAKKAAKEQGLELRAAHKQEDEYEGGHGIESVSDYGDLLDGLADGAFDVVGGTAWVWAREDFEQAVDVLIVDEAGQMALGNVLAAAPAAKSLVLLGDPQQLEQPLQSSHPEGSEASALYHWLEGLDTMPAERGLFLGTTWRLHPAIASFTSEVYYESKLNPRPGLEHQAIMGEGLSFSGSGLRYLPVKHAGNTAKSSEEAAAIVGLVRELLAGGRYIDKEQAVSGLTSKDILVVAPYNAQVAALTEALPDLAGRIGTVDKFQGQEAPVVIYSMTSSSPEDAPRGMEFLYDPHRFNVATSRARALCILVGNRALFEPECRTPRQMKMANGFCRFLEMMVVS
jgi:uncharacterized protein